MPALKRSETSPIINDTRAPAAMYVKRSFPLVIVPNGWNRL